MRSLVRQIFASLRPLGKRLSPVTLWSIFWPVAATRVAWALLDEDRLGWHDRMSRMYQRAY